MMMKKIIFLSITAITLCLSNLNAAIVYTDVNDITLAIGGSIDIDFNGDGVAEFTIQDQGFGGTTEPGIIFNSGTEHFVTVSAAEWDVVQGLPINTTVDLNSGWFDFGDAFIDPFWANTLFPTTDTYIGASFNLGGVIHYGWILVNWDANGTFIVKSYAFDDTPNMAINTGDTGVNNPVLVTSIDVQGFGGASTVIIGDGLQMEASVLPLNADNMNITWSVVNGTGTGSIDAQGILTGLSAGTVTVIATANDGSGIMGQTIITIEEDSFVVDNPIDPNPEIIDEVEDNDVLIYVPTVFTPNSGSHNNMLKVFTHNIETFKMVIYNRWGEIVYVSHDQSVPWDGTYTNQTNANEMFVWKINYTDINGAKSEAVGQILILQ